MLHLYDKVELLNPKSMKNAVLIFAILMSFGMKAQEIKPTMEKVGKMVKATYYHDNGEIAQTGHIMKGKLEGQWFMFDAEGNKLASGKYDQGVRQGKWMFWEGQELSEVDFVDNKIVSVKKWNNAQIVANYK